MSNGNYPAFACPPVVGDYGKLLTPDDISHSGLTKREAFAMAAMQGICSDSRNCGTNERRAANAVAMADALLAELEKGKEAK